MRDTRRRNTKGVEDSGKPRTAFNLNEILLRESIRKGVKIRIRRGSIRASRDVLKVNDSNTAVVLW
jgi:hypothetical protein